MPLDDQIATVIMREVTSPFPPVYPEPLIYTVSYEELREVPEDDKQAWLLNQMAKNRAADLGLEEDEGIIAMIAEGLEILFVFPGDLEPILDYRT